MRRSRKSITSRLTLLFAAISTAVLLALGLLIGNSVEQHFIEQDMEQLTGKLHLAGMNPTVKEVFDISGFSNIFTIFGTRAEALAAF